MKTNCVKLRQVTWLFLSGQNEKGKNHRKLYGVSYICAILRAKCPSYQSNEKHLKSVNVRQAPYYYINTAYVRMTRSENAFIPTRFLCYLTTG